MPEVEWGLFEVPERGAPRIIGRPHLTRESADNSLDNFTERYPDVPFKVMEREVSDWRDVQD